MPYLGFHKVSKKVVKLPKENNEKKEKLPKPNKPKIKVKATSKEAKVILKVF